MLRPTRREAEAIMREEIAKFSSRIDYMMDIKSGPREEARTLDWWRKDSSDTESAITDRNKAFLRTYHRIAGSKLWSSGLPLLDRGRVYMDRSVLRRLERDGFVRWIDGRDPYFEITPAGTWLLEEASDRPAA